MESYENIKTMPLYLCALLTLSIRAYTAQEYKSTRMLNQNNYVNITYELPNYSRIKNILKHNSSAHKLIIKPFVHFLKLTELLPYLRDDWGKLWAAQFNTNARQACVLKTCLFCLGNHILCALYFLQVYLQFAWDFHSHF